MFGPAYGHNIQPFIDFFETHSHHQLTFAYSGKNNFLTSSKHIAFIKYSKNPLSLVRLAATIKKKYDIIWYHGAYDLNLLYMIHKFKDKNSKLIINVWGEHVPRIMLQNTNEAQKFYKYYNAADIIQCNWYGVRNLLKKKFPEQKLPVLQWGLDKAFFVEKNTNNVSETAAFFVKSIAKEKINFFYPKSFTEASDHDCIIEAVKLISDSGTTNFCVYFWTGNITRGNFENSAVEKIKNYQLNDYIKIEKHEFLSFSDMKTIWEAMNCGLQISINDQLSSTLLEPMLVKKELIATNIEPYRILNDKYPELQLSLIERSPDVLAVRMKEIINQQHTPESILENRKRVVEKEFNFEKNIQKMMDFYQQLLEK